MTCYGKNVKQTSDKYFHLVRLLLVLDNINLLFSNPQAIFPRCFLCQVNDKAELQNAEEHCQVADCLPNIHCIEGSHFWPVWPIKCKSIKEIKGNDALQQTPTDQPNPLLTTLNHSLTFLTFSRSTLNNPLKIKCNGFKKISNRFPASFSTWIQELATEA